jgi:hypothetical protein
MQVGVGAFVGKYAFGVHPSYKTALCSIDLRVANVRDHNLVQAFAGVGDRFI